MKIATVIHFFYQDALDSLQETYRLLEELSIDMYISTNSANYDVARKSFPSAKVSVFPNEGYDVFPFLRIVKKYCLSEYDWVIKLHTKNLLSDYSRRMSSIYFNRLCEYDFLKSDLRRFHDENKDVGIVSALEYCRSLDTLMYGNRAAFSSLSNEFDIKATPTENDIFFAGTMFCIRGLLLRKLCVTTANLISRPSASFLASGSDGSLPHVLERFIPFYIQKSGYSYAVVTPNSLHANNKSKIIHANELWDLVPSELLHCGSNALSKRSESLQKYLDETTLDEVIDIESYSLEFSRDSFLKYSINPKSHYVLFSDFFSARIRSEKQNFSASEYRCNRLDVFRAEVPGVWHWSIRGRRENHDKSISSTQRYRLVFEPSLKTGSSFQFKQILDDSNTNLATYDPLYGDRISLALEHRDFHAVEKHALRFLLDKYLRLDYIEILAYSLTWNHRLDLAGFFWDLYVYIKRHPYLNGNKYARMIQYDKEYDIAGIAAGKTRVIPFISHSANCPIQARVCIYTSLFGGYDSLPPIPAELKGSIDFILFTDQLDVAANTFSGWTVVTCQKQYSSDNLSAKIYKIKPFEYLDKYDYSLFVDANTQIYPNFTDLVVYLLHSDASFAMFAHPFRHSLVEEACAIMSMSKAEPRLILNQLEQYIKQGFREEDSFVCEGSFIWRSHTCSKVKSLMEIWWQHILLYSHRDQVSLTYLMQDQDLYPSIIDPSIGSSRSNRFFRKTPHNHEK